MKLRRIFNSQSKTITGAATIVASFYLFSRVLGMLKIFLLASALGAGDLYDAYVASFRIPNLIFTLLITGTLSAGFIPVFTDYINKNKKFAWKLANNVVNMIMLSAIGISILLFIITPYVMKFIVPGFGIEKMHTTINFTRILLIQPIILGLSTIFSGILQSFKQFVVVAIAPLLYNIGIITGIAVLYPNMGEYGLVIGVILGAFLHMAIQVPSVILSGYKYRPIFNFHSIGLKRILKLMPSRTMSLLVLQINLFVITIIASTLGKGSISVFNYADLLQSFPLAIFGLSFSVAAFPSFADFISKKRFDKLSHSLINTLRQMMFFLIPASVLIIVLRAQVVRSILGHGKFDWTATILTIRCLKFFAIGLAAHSAILLFNKAYYALENTKTPFIIGLIGAGINISGCLILSPIMGIAGLALSFSIAQIITAITLFVTLHFKIKILEDITLLISILKISTASLISGLSAYYVLHILAHQVNMKTFIGIATQGLLAGIVGLIIYIIMSLILKIEEMSFLINLLKKKLRIREFDVPKV